MILSTYIGQYGVMADTCSKSVTDERDDTGVKVEDEDASSDTPQRPPIRERNAKDDDSARRKDSAATDRVESIMK